MEQLLKLKLSILLFVSFFFFLTNGIAASEGQFEISNTMGGPSRCFALSLLLQNNQYHIAMTCRNIIYPPDENNTKYILWARNGNDVINLGSLALGRATYSTKIAFSQLFVTLETNEKVKVPSSRIVMRGNLQDIPFLESVVNPTLTPTNVRATITSSPQDLETPQDEAVTELSTREKLLIGIKRSSIIAGIALLGLIGLIFVITRTKG